MKKIYINLLFSIILNFSFIVNSYGQVSCSGSITINNSSTCPIRIGDGTAGCIRVCITTNGISGSNCSPGCGWTGGGWGPAISVYQGNNSTYVGVFSSATANGSCFNVPVTGGSGYAYLRPRCLGAGSTSTITWTTVDCSTGATVCASCTDGIQNQGETGIDCGGPCAACVPTCTDGIQNQGETGVDCGGPCGPCGGPTCTDGIKNQDETGVDCGGATCPACPTCFDGIQNGGETGVDCGGPCALTCTTNSVPDTSICGGCPTVAQGTIYPTVCDQVGTSAYNLNSPIAQVLSCGSFTAPTPAPSCGTVGSEGTWLRYDLAPGVSQVQLAFNTGNVASGSSSTYAQAYQGTGCGALVPVTGGCQNTVDFASSVYTLYQNFFTNLNTNQDLWIFIYNSSGKAFNLNYNLVGTVGPPSNTSCATAETAIGEACNLGAPGASFTTPYYGGATCSGGGWSSNENTTFYAFTASATTASLEIGNISCNNGSSGAGQFGVWTSCAAIGTYGAGFLGCAVGTGTISLTGLDTNLTYYIAADGTAGDNCAWDFTGTNIVLPIKLSNFNAIYNKNKVDISWITESEVNNDFFTIERSKDMINFEVIDIVKGKGNSSTSNIYGTYDLKPSTGTSYYRLKQTDYDGNVEYFEPVSVTIKNKLEDVVVYPNPVTGNGYLSFHSMQESEQLISIYDIAGRIVYEKQVEVQRGENKLMLETNNLTQGMYFIKMDNTQDGINLKFIKE